MVSNTCRIPRWCAGSNHHIVYDTRVTLAGGDASIYHLQQNCTASIYASCAQIHRFICSDGLVRLFMTIHDYSQGVLSSRYSAVRVCTLIHSIWAADCFWQADFLSGRQTNSFWQLPVLFVVLDFTRFRAPSPGFFFDNDIREIVSW